MKFPSETRETIMMQNAVIPGAKHSELHQIDDENHKFRNIRGKVSILYFLHKFLSQGT